MAYYGKGEYSRVTKRKKPLVSYADGKDKLHQLAMNYYNKANGTQYEDAELLACRSWSAAGLFFHINFTGKPKNADAAAYPKPKLFFAELRDFLGGLRVRYCCIVELANAVTSCKICQIETFQGFYVYHPRIMEFGGLLKAPSVKGFLALVAEYSERACKLKKPLVSYEDGKDKLHQLSLNYYNQMNETQYEDAELLSCKGWLAAGFFYHINFKAKPKNADSGAGPSSKLFFAELSFFVDGFTVSKCCILEPGNAVYYCRFCRVNLSWDHSLNHPRETEDSKASTSALNFGNMDQHNLQFEQLPVSDCLEDPVDEEDTESSESDPIDRDLLDKEHDTECRSMNEDRANIVIAEEIHEEGTVAHSREAHADNNFTVAKLLREMEELKRSQLMHTHKINYFERELIESRTEIQHLKDKCKMLELNRLNNGELLLVAGGYDGYLQLSGLDSYSPFQDLKNPLSSMNFPRLHASAANLNGEMYVFGGVDGDSWYDTVESYDQTRDRWVSRPSLSQKKGLSASVSSHNKMFAIGGRNGGGNLSEVEMLDVNSAKWVPVQSMLEKRCSPAAAEISNVLYVVGGYNEEGYLNSVERFDPREYSWTRLESMATKRGRHSLAVLNEKLYALGGYDGHKMVSTVEVFDPRVGSWMTEGSMNEARGYFGAVVLRDAIYVLGGLNDNGTILDTVECYRQSHGWKATNLKGFGRRCAFCVALL